MVMVRKTKIKMEARKVYKESKRKPISYPCNINNSIVLKTMASFSVWIWVQEIVQTILVTIEIVEGSFRKLPSLSSASTTIQSPSPVLALEP